MTISRPLRAAIPAALASQVTPEFAIMYHPLSDISTLNIYFAQ